MRTTWENLAGWLGLGMKSQVTKKEDGKKQLLLACDSDSFPYTCLSNLDDVMRIIWKYWLLVAIYYFINHQNPCFSPHRMQQWFIFHSRACAFFFHWHAVSLHQEILPRTCIRLVKMIEKTNKQTLNYEKEEKLLLKFCFTRYAVSCTFFRWSGYVLVCSRFPAKKSRHIKKPSELVKNYRPFDPKWQHSKTLLQIPDFPCNRNTERSWRHKNESTCYTWVNFIIMRYHGHENLSKLYQGLIIKLQVHVFGSPLSSLWVKELI